MTDVNGLINKVNSLQTKAFDSNYNFNFGTHVLFKVKSVPNDPDYSQNWGLGKVGAIQSWEGLPSTTVSVAVVDTGCRRNHEDLAANLDLANGANLTSDNLGDSRNFEDGCGHGTHCAGIIAAVMNNGKGTVGVAPNVKIVPIKVLENDGVGSIISVSLGIKMAADIPTVKVISLSLGGPGTIGRMMKEAIDYASGKGKLVVVAAGNENDDAAYFSPASYEKCFCVGATTNTDSRAWFSNYGSAVDIAAPGLDIYSTYATTDSSYETLSGTSMATPFVSGLAAAIFSLNPSKTPQEVRTLIQQNADKITPDKAIGVGRINVFKTISAVSGAPGNQIPNVVLDGPESVLGDETVEYIATADDPDDSTASFSWKTNSSSPVVERFTDGKKSVVTWKAPGVSGWYEISCLVTDPKGGSKETSIRTFVKPSSISINYISPASSTIGALVNVYGANFGTTQSGGRVVFGGATATEIVSWGNTQIAAKVPSGAVSGFVQVFAAGLQSNSVAFHVHFPPGKPSISSPTQDLPNVTVNPSFVASNFVDQNSGDSHLSSDWEIYSANGAALGTKVWNKAWDQVNRTTIIANSQIGSFVNDLAGKTALSYETGYFVRVRFFDNNGFSSEWSDPVKFVTMSEPQAPPSKPVVTVAPGASLTVTPTISASSFSDPNSKSVHQSSDWELYNSSTILSASRVWYKTGATDNKSSIKIDSLNGTFENSLAGKTKMLDNTRYWIRVRYSDDSGLWSSWSDAIEFVALNTKPVISYASPTQVISIQENTTIALEALASDTDGQVTTVEFFDNGNKTHSLLSPPFVATFSSLSSGIHKISAKAIDDQLGEATTTFPDIKVFLLPPSNFTATGTTSGNSLTWTANPSATSYNVYWSETPLVSKANGTKAFSAGASFLHTGITAGKIYYYVVTAVSGAGESQESNECSASPLLGPPTSVFIAAGVDQNTITWSSVSGATAYDLIWASNSAPLLGSGTRIENVSSPYVHKNIIGLINHKYAVISKNQFTFSPLSNEVSATPQKGFKGLVSASASLSGNHTIALGSNNYVYAWGNNYEGELGLGYLGGARSTPTKVTEQGTSISAGFAFCVISKSDGSVWYWGRQPSNGITPSTNWVSLPKKVDGVSNVVSVDAGPDYVLALTSNGSVFAWGSGFEGEIGVGDTKGRGVPTEIPFLDSIVGISAGKSHSLATKIDGTVWAFGKNTEGELGLGTSTANVLIPTQIPNLVRITSVSAGGGHSLALQDDGSVWSWGNNLSGQLGIGNTISASVPQKIPELANVIAISAAYGHSLALKQDGSVWAWGNNLGGQLGDGTKENRTSPVKINALSGIVSISGGNGYSVFVNSDGTVWACGSTDHGKLGDGTPVTNTTYRLTPVQVISGD